METARGGRGGQAASLRVHQGAGSLPEAEALGPEVLSVASCGERAPCRQATPRARRPRTPPLQPPNPTARRVLAPPCPSPSTERTVLSAGTALDQGRAPARPAQPMCHGALARPPSGLPPLSGGASARCSGPDPKARGRFTRSQGIAVQPPTPGPPGRALDATPTFAVNLAVLVGKGGGLQTFAALGAAEAGLVPGLRGEGAHR